MDAANQKITLTYGGELIPKEDQESIKRKLPIFHLENTTLEIKQGFANLKDKEDINPLAAELLAKKQQISSIKEELKVKNSNLDSIRMIREIGGQVYKELKAQYPKVSSLTMQPGVKHTDSVGTNAWLVQICHDSLLVKEDKSRIQSWLKARVNGEEVFVNFNSTDTTVYQKIKMSRFESLFDRFKKFNP